MQLQVKFDAAEELHASPRHHYRLQFHANALGVEKAIEFYARSSEDALYFVMSDPAGRTVDIWEDNEYALSASRDTAFGKAQEAPHHPPIRC